MGRGHRRREAVPRAGARETGGAHARRLTMTVPSSAESSRAEDAIRASLAEVRREIACRVCRGDIKRCRLAICPYLGRVRTWFEERRGLQTTDLVRAAPPGAVLGPGGEPEGVRGTPVPAGRDREQANLAP